MKTLILIFATVICMVNIVFGQNLVVQDAPEELKKSVERLNKLIAERNARMEKERVKREKYRKEKERQKVELEREQRRKITDIRLASFCGIDLTKYDGKGWRRLPKKFRLFDGYSFFRNKNGDVIYSMTYTDGEVDCQSLKDEANAIAKMIEKKYKDNFRHTTRNEWNGYFYHTFENKYMSIEVSVTTFSKIEIMITLHPEKKIELKKVNLPKDDGYDVL